MNILDVLAPSTFIRKTAPRITSNLGGPILDIAGGSGRHTFYLASLGADVICIDRNKTMFDEMQMKLSSESRLLQKVSYCHLDLINDPWVFKNDTAGTIICVHYPITNQFLFYCNSLISGGYLLIETVGGQGGNYLELSRPGLLHELFNDDFDMKIYRERAVGPKEENRVAVKLLAQKK